MLGVEEERAGEDETRRERGFEREGSTMGRRRNKKSVGSPNSDIFILLL